MSLQEPQEQFESETVDSTEDETPTESPLSESDTFASSEESDSVDVASSGSDAPSLEEVIESQTPAKQKRSIYQRSLTAMGTRFLKRRCECNIL